MKNYLFCFQGQCERTMQDVVERIWDFIDDFNINSVLKFLKDNIVGTVVIVSLIFWVPISCLISYVDNKRAKKVNKNFISCLFTMICWIIWNHIPLVNYLIFINDISISFCTSWFVFFFTNSIWNIGFRLLILQIPSHVITWDFFDNMKNIRKLYNLRCF